MSAAPARAPGNGIELTPFYLVIDVSGSMAGERLDLVRQAVPVVLEALRRARP
jgi:uncharacterized protein YegL